jgi:hypothetical protein
MFKKQLLVLFLATLASHSLWAAQFARPVETTDAGAWTVEGTGATTHHDALNEDPQIDPDLDADFIAAGTSSTVILRLSGVSDPGGADASDHIIRYRCRVTGGGGPPERCNVAIVQGHPGGTEIYANTTVTAADDVFTLEQIAIPSATGITNYNDLYVHLTSDVGNGETIEISWFELEVPDATASVPPTVTSPTFANETDTTATLGGNVTDAGSAAVDDRGVEWGTSQGTYPTSVSEGGTGTGIFTVGVTGLPSSDVIYFRAWATSAVGTSNSAENNFTTFPTVTSPTSANVTDTTATLGGTVTADGDVAVDSRGIEWGTSPGTYPNSVPAAAGGAGTFTVPVTGLPSSDVIYFRAWATNVGGTSYSAESSFTTLPTVTSPTVDAFADTTATLGGTVTADGDVNVDSRGIEWGTVSGDTPNIEPAVAGGPGTFTVDVTGLPSNTEIFFRAWGTNAGGTGYSVESSFTTNPGQPTVDTPTATNITATTAELGGRVASDGGGTVTDRGTVWGTSPNPTGNILSQGTGTGTFRHQTTGLPTGTLVYFRAYATNAAGTAYSPDATFTPADVPTVTTPSVDLGSITTNSALLGGNVTSDGGAALTARGTVWNTTGTPVVENVLAEGGTTTGTFTHTRSGLPPDTDIFFRAYATNATHTGYSPQGQFRTEAAADTQVSNLNFATTAGQSVRLTWTRGSLDGVLVVMRSSDGAVAPTDGTDYTPNAVFGSGSLLSPGNYVVYKGIGTSVLVTGLTMSTSYSVEAYEFSGDPASPTFLPGPASATDSTTDYAVHNYDYRADCDDCHNHGSFMARGAELKGVCSTCHNPSGLAKDKLEFGFEDTWNTTGATTTGHPDPTKNPAIDVVDCGMCHELHNHTPTSTNTTYSTHSETLLEQHNKSFLRANVDKYVPNAATPAYLHTDTPYRAGPPEILADTPDRAVEGGDDSTARGYCQVCHTLTDNHRSSNTAGSDQCHDGSPGCQGTEIHCGSCHQHTNNFEGEGDCTQCHNSIRGARPIITTQFDDRVSSHVTPDVGGVTQADCEVCHDQSTHKEKTVRLNDPDGGAAHSQPTAGASTLATGEGEAFAGACIGCHDADGATRLASAGTPDQTPLSPFTDSPPPPIFDAAAWANSSHDRPVATSGSSPVTCVGGGANGCHGSGHGSENAPLLHPADTAITLDHATALCTECHDSDGPSSFNIDAQFNTGTNYRTTAADGANVNQRHDITNTPTDFATGDQTNSGGLVTCKDCHAPHANNTANPVFELDALQLDPPQYVALPLYDPAGRYNEDTFDFYYDSGGTSPTNEDPTNPLGGPSVPEPDYIQFCLACHDGTPPSASVTMSTSLINMAAAWNNDQHGNKDGSIGSNIGKGNLKPPWNTQAAYEAGDDPSNNYAALNCTTCHGAHGSGNIFNLRESITVAGVQMSTGCPGGESWCSGSEFAGTVGTSYTLPVNGGSQNNFEWGAWCTFCHNMSSHRGVDETTGCTSGHRHNQNSF